MAAAAPTPTVPSLKQSFIAAQTNLLSQPPAPSRAWRAANDASDQPISGRVLDDALLALGQTVQQHCRRVYAPQATRNVAEQISNAYVCDAERKADADANMLEEGIDRELDLANDAAIEALPPAWLSAREAHDYPMEAKRYADTVARLARLSERRKDLRRRIEKLRRLKATLAPLDTAGGAGVQENLITRNGPIESELERMRFLLARVAGRVAELPDGAAVGPRGTRDDATIDLDALNGASESSVEDFLAQPSVFPS